MNLQSNSDRTKLDWTRIDTVLLDMDGTLLDLNYDNHVWNGLFPQAYAEHHGVTIEEAREHLFAHMLDIRGSMAFYTFRYWMDYTGLDLVALHEEATDLVNLRPGADDFLRWLQANNKHSIIATNADRASVRIKQTRVNLSAMVDDLVSSHDYACPKEDPNFWQSLLAAFNYDPQRTLFIDDNEPVLDAAAEAGIGELLCVTTPDSARPLRAGLRYPGFDHFNEIYPA